MLLRNKVLLYYKGPFDETILSKISDQLRSKFEQDPKAGKKLFSVFMEAAQNISFYSEEVNYFDNNKFGRVGTIVIQETDEYYKFSAGNLISKENARMLSEKLESMKGKTVEELRAMKRETIVKPRETDKKGGNIGLIQIAIKAEAPLSYEIREVDDLTSFIVLYIEIHKTHS